MALAWESAGDRLPAEIQRAMDSCPDPILRGIRLLFALPEYQVPLPGGATASQTDVLAVGTTGRGAVVLAVEGKVDEEFGPTLGEKRVEASDGVTTRLKVIHELLGLDVSAPDGMRYQLFHRTASALLVATELGAQAAVMVVHSFSPTDQWFDDFATFARLLGVESRIGGIGRVTTATSVPLFLGWCKGEDRFRQSLSGQ